MAFSKSLGLAFCALTVMVLVDLAASSSVATQTEGIEFVKQNVSNAVGQAVGSFVTCSSDSYCHSRAGIWSECYRGYCICDLGYQSIGGVCTKIRCTWNSDCTRIAANTRCSFNSCVCDYNYYKNSYSQTCLYYSGSGVRVGLPVGIVFFFIIFACIVFVIIRRRRAQVTTRVIPVAGPSGTQYQSNPMYQQNPAYQQTNPAYPQANPYQNQAPPAYNPATGSYGQPAAPGGYPPMRKQ